MTVLQKQLKLTLLSASWEIVCVGKMRVASPLWTPAFSTCSQMAWQTT